MTRAFILISAAVAAFALNIAPSFADNDDCNSCRTRDGWANVVVQPTVAPPSIRSFALQTRRDVDFGVTPGRADKAYADPCLWVSGHSAFAPQEQISICDARDR